MKIFFLFLLLAQLNVALACVVGPRDASWSEMLSASRGAIVVKARLEAGMSAHQVFELEQTEIISDPGLLFRGRSVLGIEMAFSAPQWHDSLAFWLGNAAGGGRRSYDCRFFQRIDPSLPHILLLGVDGPYSLEPVSSEKDRWYKVVKEYFSSKPPRPPLIILTNPHDHLTPIESTGCTINDYSRSNIESFIECVAKLSRNRPTHVVMLVDGVRRVAILADGENPSFSRKSLVDALGADFGFSDTVTLRSLLENQLGTRRSNKLPD